MVNAAKTSHAALSPDALPRRQSRSTKAGQGFAEAPREIVVKDDALPSPRSETLEALRRAAEHRLIDHPVLLALSSDANVRKLLHELQVYQAELEIQVETLRENQIAAENLSQRLGLALDAASAGLWDWDVRHATLYLSPRCLALACLPSSAMRDPAALLEAVHPDDRHRVVKAIREAFATGDEPAPVDFRIRAPQGATVWLQCTGRAVDRDGDGMPRRMVGTLSDITRRKQMEEQLRIAAVAFQSRDAMVVTDRRGTILRVNQAFSEVTGYSAEEAVGQTPALLKSGRHSEDFYRTLWEAVAREGHWEGEIWNRRKDGSVFTEWLAVSAVRDEANEISHYIGTFSDISEPRERERKIVELAFYDPLTTLPNRRLFGDRLRQALAASARSRAYGAVLLLDLDHFKILNESRGHEAGDQLLAEVARRLRGTLRETDSAARLGGDEFAVLLEGLHADEMTAAKQAEAIAEKLRLTVGAAIPLGDGDHHATPSIGITLFLDPHDTIDTVMRKADLALYQAKDAGRDTIRFYSPEMQAAVEARAAIEAGLRRALDEDRLELHYQAKVDLRHGGVVGAEALLRWNDGFGKLVPPDAFIPLAEETGLIIPIGNWVIGEACRQMAAWKRQGLPAIRVAVNVSARQFQQADLTQVVAAALDAHGVPPQALELELTESAVMGSPEKAAAMLRQLKDIGVRISLDDFGTGYSSLGQLKRFPIDSVKIDRSFVRDITSDPDDATIASMIIALAHSLKQTVVAEGVETEAQLQFLQAQDCDEMQGYFFSRPLPAGEFRTLLREQRRLAPITPPSPT